MNFSLIVCTYQRPQALVTLLKSVAVQSLYPSEILIIDGSLDNATQDILQKNAFNGLRYFIVTEKDRGLTRQRNFGIERVQSASEIVCFLDDDVVLSVDYFEKLIGTYSHFPDALGVGGYIANESDCEFVGDAYQAKIDEYVYDGWKRKDGSRFILRKKLGLDSDCPPGYSTLFSHGRSVGFLPPSGKSYPVEQLMGGVSSFKKTVFKTHTFSKYFEGYGLYEDADFTIRVSKTGQLYCNTSATLEHFHDVAGRPNQYRYGKMVVRNGWYVWKVKNPKPDLKATFKWLSITLLLTFIRYTNVITTNQRKQALTEAFGRTVSLFGLIFIKPK